ncbi:Uncharacterized protein DBV15_04670 [Temnothorax longispinosus]|uniref:MARVEL domain-containing protein n=1 Tax=Temnothorax longispinosus TaxID=300112 RepID=A0A4V3S7J5_9HYME|nr:Uncharacterized protein DBV15_04670 [Temnothorax longispinosus]
MTSSVEYLKSWNGIFKIMQLVLGTICVGIIGNEFSTVFNFYSVECYFLIATCTFYIATFILFIGYLMSPSAASIIPKTIYANKDDKNEFLYHSIASILLLAASIALMVQIHKRYVIILHYKALLAASICSLLNTILYVCSAVIGFGTYRLSENNLVKVMSTVKLPSNCHQSEGYNIKKSDQNDVVMTTKRPIP